ncbi:MAG: hypothetical protein AAGC55_09245 [Myxococcota bacterium]
MTLALLLVAIVLSPVSALAHGGHTGDAPLIACADTELGDGCAFVNDHGDRYRGTCRSISGSLRCVRNRPIERADSTAALAAPARSDAPVSPWSGMVAGVALFVLAFTWPLWRRVRRRS